LAFRDSEPQPVAAASKQKSKIAFSRAGLFI
jgi:hypothetical protein